MIGLPDGIWPLGAVPVDQLIPVAIGGWPLMDEAQHGRIERIHHSSHCRVGRDAVTFLFGSLRNAPAD